MVAIDQQLYPDRVDPAYRPGVVAETSPNPSFDELYGNDAMQRLQKFNRGTFLSSPSPSTGEGGGEGVLPPITGPTLQQGWHLDATGNWTNFSNVDQLNSANTLDQQRASNTANEIMAINRTVGPQLTTPAYDRNGNMTSVPQPTNMAEVASAVWDAWNRLVGYTDSSFNPHSSVYDGLGRRVIHAEADTPRNYYYCDRWQVVEERIAPYTAPERQFVGGLRYIDDLILRDRAPSGSGPLSERLFAMHDANWNVAAICDPTAAVKERYAYTAYGVVQFLNASFAPLSGNISAFGWETLYCGYRYDPTSGLCLSRRRQLNPALGTWLRRDPIGGRSDHNFFRYVRSNPTGLIDPSGAVPEPEWGEYGDDIADEVSDAGYSLACGKKAHDEISRWVEQLNKSAYRTYMNKSVKKIAEVEEASCKCKSMRRPDIVLLRKGKSRSGFLYEIKPDSPYGRTRGPVQVRRYRRLLKRCCLDVQLGDDSVIAVSRPPSTQGRDPFCGTLHWKLAEDGLVLYVWHKRRRGPKTPTGVPVIIPAIPASAAGGAEVVEAVEATATFVEVGEGVAAGIELSDLATAALFLVFL